MKGARLMFFNLVILVATSLLLNSLRISFQVYLSNKIGPAGIGLFQLIMSVYFLCITFAVSGARLAAVRLVAEELGAGLGAGKAVRSCLIYGLFFGLASCVALFVSAGYIGSSWLCDTRTVLSLRMLSFCLPFLSMSSVLGGYFTAVRQAAKPAFVQLTEQLLRIFTAFLFLPLFINRGLEYACAAIVVGICAGELSSFLLLLMFYCFDTRRRMHRSGASRNIIGRLLHIALPCALSSYITSAMRTVQHLLVPFCLKKSGVSSESSLSVYGKVHGMVLPVLMFPSVISDTISDLLIPELARCRACGNITRLGYIINRIFKFGIFFSVGVMFLFFSFSAELAEAIFGSGETAFYIRILSPVIPLIYLDTVVDGMLKGTGEHISSMRYNIIDSFLSIMLIYILLPRYSVSGYIFTFYLARAFNFTLSINKLIKTSGLRIHVPTLIKAFICITCARYIVFFLFKNFTCPLFILIIATIFLYFILLRILSCITRDDLIWLRSIFKFH